jgi:hypothetical protein
MRLPSFLSGTCTKYQCGHLKIYDVLLWKRCQKCHTTHAVEYQNVSPARISELRKLARKGYKLAFVNSGILDSFLRIQDDYGGAWDATGNYWIQYPISQLETEDWWAIARKSDDAILEWVARDAR